MMTYFLGRSFPKSPAKLFSISKGTQVVEETKAVSPEVLFPNELLRCWNYLLFMALISLTLLARI